MSCPFDSLDEAAMHYAMVARRNYESYQLGGDGIESELAHLFQQMGFKFGYHLVQPAIDRAQDILKMMDFHPEPKE
jgi:hypothetical protein